MLPTVHRVQFSASTAPNRVDFEAHRRWYRASPNLAGGAPGGEAENGSKYRFLGVLVLVLLLDRR